MKAKQINIFLVVFSVLITYLLLEFFIFKHFIRYLPLDKHLFLPSSVQVLAQSSKQGCLPKKNYIAILGDSYALGYGDWLTNIDTNRNLTFHSAHVLHELTGKDVISFGKSSRGSLGGIVIQPIKKFEYINNLILFSLPKPDTVLIYFYEGNDLYDNLKRIERKYDGKYNQDRIYDQHYFKNFIEDSMQKNRSFNLFKNFIFGRFIHKMIVKNINSLFSKEEDETEVEENMGFDLYRETNMAVITGAELRLPPLLQGPALGLESGRMKLALYVFDQSLAYIKNYFEEALFVVVYIPSVLSSYTIVSKFVSESKSGNRIFLTEEMYKNSNYIAAKVKEFTEKQGMFFIDTRADLRKATEKEILHGPKDWKHFNKKGYHLLANSIFNRLKSWKFLSH